MPQDRSRPGGTGRDEAAPDQQRTAEPQPHGTRPAPDGTADESYATLPDDAFDSFEDFYDAPENFEFEEPVENVSPGEFAPLPALPVSAPAPSTPRTFSSASVDYFAAPGHEPQTQSASGARTASAGASKHPASPPARVGGDTFAPMDVAPSFPRAPAPASPRSPHSHLPFTPEEDLETPEEFSPSDLDALPETEFELPALRRGPPVNELGGAHAQDESGELPGVDAGILPDDSGLEALGEMPMPAPRAPSPDTTLGFDARRKMPLGQLLLSQGIIQEDQLEIALQDQRRTRTLLGEVLISLGFVSEQTIAETVSAQTGIPFVRVTGEPLAPALLKMCPEDVCRRHRLVPLGAEGSVLRLAMANPFDVVAVDFIRQSTGLIPFPSIAPWGDIQKAIERYFTRTDSFDDHFEQIIAAAEARANDLDAEETVGGPLVELVDQLIIRAAEDRATDIHIEPEENILRIRYRIDGILQPGPTIPKKLQLPIAARVKVMSGLNVAENRVPQDGRIRFAHKGRNIDLRVSTFLCNYGENIVLRVLDKASVVLSLEKLGLLPDDLGKMEKVIQRPHGIILVTGPTGSGKTTTLYASLSKLNTIDVNIMTIEDPIEYELNLIRQSQVNVKAGITFASGLRALLRQDPDIILIGEMRDGETAEMAIRAAMTGHLVFSTLHTNTAVGAINRMVDMGVEPMLVSDTVICAIGQRLCRTVCQKCKAHVPAPPQRRQELEEAAAKEKLDWDGMVAEPRGCLECKGRGYHGRTAIYEFFEMTHQAQSLILQRKWGQDLSDQAHNDGMRAMYEDGLRRVIMKHLTLEELDRVIERELHGEVM